MQFWNALILRANNALFPSLDHRRGRWSWGCALVITHEIGPFGLDLCGDNSENPGFCFVG
jgi:hypothetical protein